MIVGLYECMYVDGGGEKGIPGLSENPDKKAKKVEI